MSTKKVTQKTESSQLSQAKKSAPRAKKARIKGETLPPAAAAPSAEEIQARAYEIFRSGANPRDPAADWFQAERELRSGPNA
ncbi:MAG: DUF2934 domain-containing protein [Vicinamibacteria bacterium]